ncbi:HAMP domain-containing histidine kinase [Brevibacillus composti]|uniref:histidine kinase n=1 Tax=Brevibacillus composti TaxID=2796470 RepID=A0A7T5EMJ9_9BACL|nr:HAMP domain-containing sensor histidine kinase [Brevibacillus composti]QQE75386.1 HAMP domain-containing histidine kinase [Brevibacillus composti]QUO42412.1 HAMP domain-containing histidine kinase [Brevibacillus composti]
MSIRLRLLLSYTAMLLVTVLLFVAAVFLIAVAVTGDVQHVRDLFTSRYAVMPLTEPEETVSVETKFLGKDSPEKLLDPRLLQELEQRLEPVNAGLLVRRGGEIYYASPVLRVPGMDQVLPGYEFGNIHVRDILETDGRYFAYVKFDFTYSDKTAGGVYVMKEVSPYAELARSLLPVLILFLLLMLALMNGLLNLHVSRSIVRPLNKLKTAAERIRDGELDFHVDSTRRDEIGQLSQTFEDMRKKLKESVELQLQYEENRKELISNISHDLKTPITSILGYVEGIRDGVADTPEKLDKYLDTIARKAKGMDRLIDELFLYSKLDLGKLPFTFERIDIERFLDDYLTELQFDLEERHVALRWEKQGLASAAGQKAGPGQEKAVVLADREKLRRVLANIVDNSLKYMDKAEGQLRFDLRIGADEVVIEVADNGPGIAPQDIPHIFERFYRGEKSRNADSGGSGLGLAIARQIVHEHRGFIAAKAVPGKGTTIIITLPREKGAER